MVSYFSNTLLCIMEINELVQDWCDLWRPELAGKISMVDSPREIVGAVLKHMGASYNTRDIDIEVPGGKKSMMEMLKKLQRQV